MAVTDKEEGHATTSFTEEELQRLGALSAARDSVLQDIGAKLEALSAGVQILNKAIPEYREEIRRISNIRTIMLSIAILVLTIATGTGLYLTSSYSERQHVIACEEVGVLRQQLIDIIELSKSAPVDDLTPTERQRRLDALDGITQTLRGREC